MALAVETNAEIDAFYERVARRALHPLWLNPNVDAPRSDVRPWLWPWQTLRPSMLEAAEFIRVLQRRQGQLIAAPEEIAFHNGWIAPEQLEAQARRFGKTQYGARLLDNLRN